MTTDLQREHEALIQFLYLFPVGVVQMDRCGDVAMMNPVATQLLMPLAPRGRIDNLIEILDPWAPTLRNLIFDYTADSGAICENLRVNVATQRKGRPVAGVLSLTLIQISPARLAAVLSDVTGVVAQERELQEKEAHLRAIFDSVREFGLYTIDPDGRILSWNRSGQRLKGYTEDEAVGRHFSEFYPQDHDPAAPRELLDRARSGGWAEDEGPRVRKDGSRFWANSLTTVLMDENGRMSGFTRVTRDVTARREMEQALEKLARTDHLTGIANRRHLREMAELEVSRWRRHRRPLSLLCMDIDHFKLINDGYGHAAGDKVLREFAAGCRAELRETDILGRFGGEEFVAVLPDAGLAEASEVAERVRCRVEALVIPYGEHSVDLTVSIGVAEMCDVARGLDGLIRAADESLYEAKRSGRNKVIAASFAAV